MNILNKILKRYGDIYHPHKQVMESLKINKYLYIVLILIVIEGLLGQYMLYLNKDIWGIIFLLFYGMTIAIGSIFHFKYVEKKFGSLEEFDLEKMNKFVKLVDQEVKIDLTNKEQNQIINQMILEKLERENIKEQKKRAFTGGIFTVLLIPILLPFIIENNQDILILTVIIMLVGIAIIFFSFKSILKDYSLKYKLERISDMLKEILIFSLRDKSL